jgi:hypothetical protein
VKIDCMGVGGLAPHLLGDRCVGVSPTLSGMPDITYSESAVMVSDGFTPRLAGTRLPSAT